MTFDKEFIDNLLAQAGENPRRRQNFDLRTGDGDGSQRMLNALLPGTVVPVHRHPHSSETVVLLCGRLDEVIYEEVQSGGDLPQAAEASVQPVGDLSQAAEASVQPSLREVERIHLCPGEGRFGCQVPAGAWHTVEVLEPSVIFEAKDGAYGQDGSAGFPG